MGAPLVFGFVRPVRAWRLVALSLVALGAAIVLAGPLWHFLAWTGWRPEFGSTFRRTALVLVLAAIAWELRPWRDVPADAWGLRGRASHPSQAWIGAGLAIVLLGSVLALDGATGHLSWDPEGAEKMRHRWWEVLARSALVAPLEEVFFRGWLYDRFARRARPFAAAALVSAVFALPHVFKASVAPRGLDPSPSGALAALSAWVESAGDLSETIPRLVGLFFLGMALVAARRRTGSLWLGIGLHAAGLAVMAVASALSTRIPERDAWGSKWLYDGPPAWVLLTFVFLLFWKSPAGPEAGQTPR